MADKLLRKGVVLAKVEIAVGTDAAPTATNILLSSIPQHAVSGNKMARDYMRNSLSPSGFTVGAKKQTISFSCELKGPNDAALPDTATYLDALLQACGLIGTAGMFTGTDEGMLYKPTSNQTLMKTATIHYYLDGIKHALVGCRGNATFEFPVDGYPKVNFSMTGFYAAPVDGPAPLGIIYPDFEPPPAINLGFKVGAYVPTGVEKITLDLGNKISEKKDVNSTTGLSSILITGREGKVTVDMDIDTLGNFNAYDIWEKGALNSLGWVAGIKGNRVGIDCPTARMDEPAKADKDGRAIWNLSFQLTGADDEYTIKTG